MQTFATQILVLCLNVMTGIFTARVLGPEGRGIFTAVTFWPTFMAMLFMLGLPNAIVFHLGRPGQGGHKVVTVGLMIGLLLASAGTGVGVVLILCTMRHAYAWPVVQFALFSTSAVTLISYLLILLRPVFIVLGRIGTVNNASWASPSLYLLLLALAWSVAPMTAEVAASCQFIAAFVVLIWLAIRLGKLCRPDFHGFGGTLGSIASYTARGAAGELLSALAFNLDRLVLVTFLPAAAIGYYMVAYSLSRILTVVQAALGSVALPAMTARSADDAVTLHNQLFRFTCYGLFAIAGLSVLVSGPALRLLYGNSFDQAVPLFDILTVEAVLSCLGSLTSQIYMALGRPGLLSGLQAVSFAVTAAALLVLVPQFGATGAAAGVLFGSGVRLTLSLWGFRAYLGVQLPSLVPRPDDLQRLAGALGHR